MVSSEKIFDQPEMHMIYQFRASQSMTITLRTQMDGDALMKHTNARKKEKRNKEKNTVSFLWEITKNKG